MDTGLVATVLLTFFHVLLDPPDEVDYYLGPRA
jgi:hypothetical protein